MCRISLTVPRRLCESGGGGWTRPLPQWEDAFPYIFFFWPKSFLCERWPYIPEQGHSVCSQPAAVCCLTLRLQLAACRSWAVHSSCPAAFGQLLLTTRIEKTPLKQEGVKASGKNPSSLIQKTRTDAPWRWQDMGSWLGCVSPAWARRRLTGASMRASQTSAAITTPALATFSHRSCGSCASWKMLARAHTTSSLPCARKRQMNPRWSSPPVPWPLWDRDH